MNLCEALKEARNRNLAITHGDWREGSFAFHGMDNELVGGSKTGEKWTFICSISGLLSERYELSELATYHGDPRTGS